MCDEQLKTRLDACTHDQIPIFSFNGLKCWCKCVGVYDGDTVTVVFDYKGELIKDHIRLWGINTPEIRTRDAAEKEAGLSARDYLREQILDRIIWVEFFGEDKYGRSLGKLFITSDEQECINDQLVKLGYAKEYMR